MKQKSILKGLFIVGAALFLTGCFKVTETGQVGIKTTKASTLQYFLILKISRLNKFQLIYPI